MSVLVDVEHHVFARDSAKMAHDIKGRVNELQCPTVRIDQIVRSILLPPEESLEEVVLDVGALSSLWKFTFKELQRRTHCIYAGEVAITRLVKSIEIASGIATNIENCGSTIRRVAHYFLK